MSLATETLVPVMTNPFLRAWPKNETGGAARYTPLTEALSSKFGTDAHFAAYSVPSIARRLDKKVVGKIGSGLPMVAVAFDVDGPEHQASEAWWHGERVKLERLFESRSGFAYRTKGGYRIVFLLAAPIYIMDDADARAWRALYVSWCNSLTREFRIASDRSCKEWGRLFRLPHATRDGNAPEMRETIGDASAIGAWNSEMHPLAAEDFAIEEERNTAKAKESPRTLTYSGPGRLVTAFDRRGWLGDEIETGKYAARCPFEESHSCGETYDGSTVLYEADTAHGDLGWFHCSHGHCAGRTIEDVIGLFSDEEMSNPMKCGATTKAGKTCASTALYSDRKCVFHSSAFEAKDELALQREKQRADTKRAADDQPLQPGRPLRNRSYLAAVTIIEKNVANVLGGKRLAFNEMQGCETLGGARLTDIDVSRIRAEIERSIAGGQDKNGNETGLALSYDDVHAAVRQVAAANNYSPVRDYLAGLEWDGSTRIERVVPEVLGAEPSKLNIALLRRWMICAVARALQPGCKVDTVLILVGKQGVGKSTVFRVLAGDDYFSDSAIDIGSKDAYLALRRSWILEWSELESLKRARDPNAVKAFISSQSDQYRPSYGRFEIQVPRSGVIVGSTNTAEFLADETGARRFWPLTVGDIDIGKLRAWRDQLWAEAVVAYNAGEQWWLSHDEEEAIAEIHEAHAVSDAWEAPVLGWAQSRLTEGFTTADVLKGTLEKPTGNWQRADEMRVAKVLRRAGYARKKQHRGDRLWVR